MAITFLTQIPSDSFRPSANPINITIRSNNNNRCNFRVVVDLYINDVKVFRFKIFPDPSTGYSFVQLQEVINDYLESYPITYYVGGINIGTNILSQPNKSAVKVYIKVGEEYDNSPNCDGDIQLYPDLATSNTFYVFYGAFSYEDFPRFNTTGGGAAQQYVTTHSASSTNKINFLTFRPRDTYECSYMDSLFVDYLCTAAPITTGFGRTNMIVIDDKNNIYTFPAPTINVLYKRLRVAIGPHNINLQRNDTIINGTTKYYDVYIATGSTILTETIRVNIIPPKKYRTRIGFINQLGSPEYVTFYHKNNTTIDIDRRNYKQYLTRRVADLWTYQRGDRQLTTFQTNAVNRHTVTSFVSPKYSVFLQELWLSNEVWIEKRPRFYSFRSYRENSSPTSKLLFWVENGHEITTSMSVLVYSDNEDYVGKHAVVSVTGNVVDIGFTVINYPTDACGYLVVFENPFFNYPIVPEDNSLFIQEKTGGLITYTFNYIDSPNKIVLN